MSKIITLTEAKLHLRYDDDDSDSLIEAYIEAAESAVLSYVTDEFANCQYPKQFKTAVLILLGYFDQHRNAEKETPINGNYLPQPVVSLLYPFRKPTAI